MMGTAWIGFQAWAIRRMDALAARRARGRGLPAHLATGERGEREALFHLRKMGYTVVARRWRSAKLWGDIDLIGRDGMAAESAVDREKLDMLRRMARAYLRGFPEKLREEVPVRFDVVSVYLLPDGVEFDLYRGAFGW
jgi:putative endonuclease